MGASMHGQPLLVKDRHIKEVSATMLGEILYILALIKRKEP
jgi:hypothetical protein